MQRARLSWCAVAVVCTQQLGCAFVLDFDALKEQYAPVDAGKKPAPSKDESSAGQRDASVATADQDAATGATSDPSLDAATPSTPSLDAGDAALDGGDSGDAAHCGPCEAPDACSVASCVAGRCVIGPKECIPSQRCVASVCEQGECVETPVTGLVKTAFNEVVEAEALYRSELIAAGDRFFRATYGKWDKRRELRLASFRADQSAALASLDVSSELAKKWPDALVVSPAAIAAETSLQNLQLFVYAAIENPGEPDDAPKQMIELLVTRDLTGAKLRALSDEPNYHFRSDRSGPSAALGPDGSAFAVWEGCSVESSDTGPECVAAEPAGGRGGVYISDALEPLAVAAPKDHFLPESRRIFALNALRTDTTRGALWLAQKGANETALGLGFEGAAPNPNLPQCAASEADEVVMSTGYALDAWQMTDSRWGASWSTRNGSEFDTQLSELLCGETSCEPNPEIACQKVDELKSQVTRTWQRDGDPALRLLRARARVLLGGDESRLVLAIEQLDLSDEGNEATPLSEVVLATGPVDGGPDWASLAPLAPNLLAVSWLEPGTPHTLHVETYDVCAP